LSTYLYKGEPKRQVFGPLPAGDYQFVVAEVDEPYEAASGNLVLPVKLTILPDGIPVFCNPWVGTDKNDEERDGIAEFLLAINRVPKIGQEPDWKRVVGARGRCRLKVKIAEKGNLAGKEVNELHYFHRPKEAGAGTGSEQPGAVQDYSKSDLERARKEAAAASNRSLEPEPDDIPY
jgi:hypothetical protein